MAGRLTPGTIVTLTPGTRVGIDSGEKFEWGGTKYDWFVVDEGDAALPEFVANEYRITGSTGPHATMNGGGFDYSMECTASYIKCIVRTTLSRSERATFNLV